MTGEPRCSRLGFSGHFVIFSPNLSTTRGLASGLHKIDNPGVDFGHLPRYMLLLGAPFREPLSQMSFTTCFCQPNISK